jgi:hypothetical protein
MMRGSEEEEGDVSKCVASKILPRGRIFESSKFSLNIASMTHI